MEQLYRKVTSLKGKITYVPHREEILKTDTIDQSKVNTLLSTFVLSLLMSVGEQLPPHKKMAREIKKLEDAVFAFAKLDGKELDGNLITIGVEAWNKAIQHIQDRLGGYDGKQG